MDKTLNGKNVLVTGSSRGIGLGIARELGRRGANVVLNCCVSEAEMSLAVLELESLGINVLGIQGDVSVYSECQKIFSHMNERFGQTDILVNNAGISSYGLFTYTTPDEWEKITRVNLFSVFNCCSLALPGMIARKCGHIINISSIWGVSGASCETVYSASKGAVNAFTKALAKEAAPSGVFVNAIACGVIETKMNEDLSEADCEELKQRIGLMRFGTPDDVAALCIYLAETEYMTGQVLTLDGNFPA